MSDKQENLDDLEFNEDEIEEEGFGDTETGTDSLYANSSASFTSEETIEEVLNDLIDYVQGQGEVEPSDEELKGVIDDYLYEKIDQGEIHEDAATETLRARILDEYKQRLEEQYLEDEEEEF